MASQSPISIAQLVEVAADLLATIAEDAARRELDRHLPVEHLRELASRKLGTWRVPADHGGPDGNVLDVIRFFMDLAAADPNVAQAIRSHFAFVEMVRSVPDDEVRKKWLDHVLAGELFAIASGETGGRQGDIATRVTRRKEHWELSGTKFYTTGALFADQIAVRAADDTDTVRMVVVPATRGGVARADDWDGMGQRLTASGTTRFDRVRVDAEEFLPVTLKRTQRSPVSPYLQLILLAIEAGIARNALSDAINYTRERARPISHSSAIRSTDDPYVQHIVGEMSARTYSAESIVLRAAATVDAVYCAIEVGADPQRPLHDASVEVAQAQVVVVESVLKVTELLFDVGGASTTRRMYNLDRHWRNARTLANHNPRAHKAGALGAHHLNGSELPTSGFF